MDPSHSEFLDLVGHELRVPITAMRGQIQLLQRRLRKEAARDADLADLDRVLFQVERMNHALQVILDAAHIAQCRLHLMPAANDLLGVVRRQVNAYAAASRAHMVELDAADEPMVAEFDRIRIEMVIGVLLANALKYSPGGQVRVRVSRGDGHGRVEVSDAGIGVLPGERRRIFQAYGRGSNVENAGLGLGLYVAREVVRRHHGRIGLLRGRQGSGSTFWFSLPLSAPLADD